MSISAIAVAERVPATGEQTDHQLVAAVRRGDDVAFERLYARYQRRIAAYVYGMVLDYGRAEDVTQEVFISALRRMRETERPIAFKPWIYEIAKNACIDQFRRSRRGEEVSYDALEGMDSADHGRLASASAAPEAVVDTKQQLTDLCGAFGGLSEAHHQILVLRELEGLSYREIGERMGLSHASVESTLFRARRRLSEEYAELVSGERCRRVQTLMRDGSLGTRDSRRLAQHLSHCQPCRRQAHLLGLDPSRAPRRRGRAVVERIAGLLPLPAFLRFRRDADAGDPVGPSLSVHAQTHAAQWSGAFGSLSEPVLTGGWGRGVATAASVAIASVGASIGADHGSRPVSERAAPPPAAVSVAPPRVSQPIPAPRGAAQRLSDRTVAKPERRGPIARLPRRTAGEPTTSAALRPAPAGAGAPSGPLGSGGPALPQLPDVPSVPPPDPDGAARPLSQLVAPAATGGANGSPVPQRPIRDAVVPELEEGAATLETDAAQTLDAARGVAEQSAAGAVAGVQDLLN